MEILSGSPPGHGEYLWVDLCSVGIPFSIILCDLGRHPLEGSSFIIFFGYI